jgi:putative addiction module antidote
MGAGDAGGRAGGQVDLWYYIRYNQLARSLEAIMIALKLTQVGNSVGVVLPKEALIKLGVEKGDTVYLTDGAGGEMRLSAYSAEVAEEIALGEEFMDQYRDTFRALAK